MTEEEKKAIEILKGISEDDLLNYWEGPEEPYNAIQVVLNLIQKQDTEINKLNKEKEYYKKLYNESYNFLDPKFTGNHIPSID